MFFASNIVDKAVEKIISITDKVILNRPRIAGVGYGTYVLWSILVYMASLRDIVLGLKEPVDSIIISITIANSPWPVGFIVIGPLVTRALQYVDRERKIRAIDRAVQHALIISHNVPPRIVKKNDILLFIFFFIIVYAALIVNKLLYDEATMTCIRFLLISPQRGIIASLFEITSLAAGFLLGLVIATSIGYIVMAYRNMLIYMEKEIKNMYFHEEPAESLNTVLLHAVSSSRPAMELMRMIRRTREPIHYVNSIIKRLILIIVIIIVYIIYSLLISHEAGAVSFITMAASIIGISITLVTLYQLYLTIRLSGELKMLILVALRDIRVRAYIRSDHTTAAVLHEMEGLLREYGQPVIHRREIWELVSALIMLASTIIALLSSA